MVQLLTVQFIYFNLIPELACLKSLEISCSKVTDFGISFLKGTGPCLVLLWCFRAAGIIWLSFTWYSYRFLWSILLCNNACLWYFSSWRVKLEMDGCTLAYLSSPKDFYLCALSLSLTVHARVRVKIQRVIDVLCWQHRLCVTRLSGTKLSTLHWNV